MRSNMFANIENKFQFSEKDEIRECTLSSLGEILSQMDTFDDTAKFGIAIIGAKLGVAGKTTLNEKEKELVDIIFGPIWNGEIDEIYAMVGSEILESDYDFVSMLLQLGNSIAMPFLHYILGFAYIDEKFEDDVAEKLDSLFGMNLLASFFESGMEEVPAPQIQLTGLDAEILQWFQANDELRKLEDVQQQFALQSKDDVKQSLDSLCEKGVLYKVETIVGNMYGLV